MKLLVVGMGSIGQRHAEIATNLGWDVSVVSSYPSLYKTFSCVSDAVRRFKPNAAVIAKPTHEHLMTALEIEATANGINILVEKPLFHEETNFKPTRNHFYVAYNMRFHPIFQRINELIKGTKVIYAHVTVGSYLPDWRPNRDYRKSYSAHRDMGGGVLLDLSHEVDCAVTWFGGNWEVTAISKNSGTLEIDSDDFCMSLLTRKDGPTVLLHMDYLSRVPFRRGIITCQDKTILYDFIKGSIQVSGCTEENYICERNDTYRSQLLALESNPNQLCSLQEGIQLLGLLNSIRQNSNYNLRREIK